MSERGNVMLTYEIKGTCNVLLLSPYGLVIWFHILKVEQQSTYITNAYSKLCLLSSFETIVYFPIFTAFLAFLY